METKPDASYAATSSFASVRGGTGALFVALGDRSSRVHAPRIAER